MVDLPVRVSPHVKRARVAIFTIFAVNGFLFAVWVVHIPMVERRTDTSHATLGSLLLLLAIGAIVGMQAAGRLSDRFGSNRLVMVSASMLAVALMGPALSTGVVTLGASLFVLGMCNGALDVAMNAQAVEVERMYPRPIMSAFHALFSVGGVLGSLIGAVTLGAELPIEISVGGAGVLGLIAIASCRSFLLRATHPAMSPDRSDSPALGWFSPRVLGLGALAFALFLSEGVANDWSTLQVKEHLGTSDGIAALAFGFFASAMTIGRFCADRISAQFGPVAVVRYGNLVAAAGMLLVLVSESLPLTLAGWAAFGLGLSGSIPQIFTSAGNLGSGAPATNMSRVVGMGYVGFLAGPAVIGWLSHVVPLTAAMAVPLALTLLAAATAGTVRPTHVEAERT
ncbi:MFS transporter [Rhodococcus sp. H36-A4]|uniref:MFS transporter n=1 Tax=Rhodococcus sp. H36-A4 TaxID=3004353 RepID=UPI0022AFD3E4|nr:MFS transporter [Rhodococcus sp. H36-A4]MCZ4080216.1 MFS transporter [Rhodococcus sp. H36-A4]